MPAEEQIVEVPLSFLVAVQNALEIAHPTFGDPADEDAFNALADWLGRVQRWVYAAEGHPMRESGEEG